MGKAWSKVKHPLRDFNLERRVEKVLEDPHAARSKPSAEPYKKPDEAIKLHQKDAQLVDRTFKMPKIETSEVPMSKIHDHHSEKHPLSRKPVPETPFGYPEPENVSALPVGRIALSRLLELVAEASRIRTDLAAAGQEGSDIDNAMKTTLRNEDIERLGKDFRLKPDQVRNIIEHFRLFDLHVPRARQPKLKEMQQLSENLRLGIATSLTGDDKKPSPKRPLIPSKSASNESSDRDDNASSKLKAQNGKY